MNFKKDYTELELQKALEAIKNGMPKKRASIVYNIPRGTLQCRLNGKSKKSTKGPSTVLFVNEEEQLVNYVVECQKKGFPRRKDNIQNIVKNFLDTTPRPNPFKNNRPGDKWYSNFLKRHNMISERVPTPVTAASANVSENDIRNWFTKIQKYLVETNNVELLNQPERLFNTDETNFLLCPKIGKVLAGKGAKDVFEVDKGAAKENLSVLFTFSAVGSIVPPMIIYPYKRMPQKIVQSVPGDWGIATSETGWMISDIFYKFIKNIFHPFLLKSKIKLPVILFLDGHKSHLNLELCNLCRELEIILICLYPNSTRILQPADVAAFRPWKIGWRKAVIKFREDNPDEDVTKVNFAPLLETALISHVSNAALISGFRACGLYPFDENAIKYEKCLGRNNTSKVHNDSQLQNNCITYLDFKDIVGSEKCIQFENFENSTESFTEEFLMLYKMYKLLKSCPSNEIMEIDNTDSIEFDINLENEENYECDIGDVVDYNNVNVLAVANIDTINEYLPQITIPKIVSNTLVKVANKTSIVEENTITQFLVPFKTPEKKRTKKPQYNSLVITSDEWKNSEAKKIDEKNKILEYKIEKKKLMLKRKLEKENLKKERVEAKKKNVTKKTKQNKNQTILSKSRAEIPMDKSDPNSLIENVFDSISSENIFSDNERCFDGLCFICASNIVNVGMKCGICSRKFHITCTKKNDQLGGNNLFVCKACQKQSNMLK